MDTQKKSNKSISLGPQEHIIMEARKHMIVLYARLLFIVGLFFLPLIFSPLIIKAVDTLTQTTLGTTIFGFFFALWLVVLLVLFVYQWTDYYLDVWVVTNKRLIDIEQKGFFTREMTTCPIEKIQDVSVEIDGVIATFFKFGIVHIHTAGERHDFSIQNARDPFAVKNAIMHALGNNTVVKEV